ncbi:hypothetical protein K1719_042606 [Acacia pycnantha]|nr:hypothetical protein K1719_042606 [Acacia pycnantha]
MILITITPAVDLKSMKRTTIFLLALSFTSPTNQESDIRSLMCTQYLRSRAIAPATEKSTPSLLLTLNTTNPEDLLSFDPEIERTIITTRRVLRLIHKINTELDTQLESDPDHSDCVHSVDLSDCTSDSISDSLVVSTDSSSNFANSDMLAEEQADRPTLKELVHFDVNYQPLCIQYRPSC